MESGLWGGEIKSQLMDDFIEVNLLVIIYADEFDLASWSGTTSGPNHLFVNSLKSCFLSVENDTNSRSV